MHAKTLPEYVSVVTVEAFDGITCLVVDCPDFNAYKALPDALEYDSTVHGKTGWNSDRCLAYFRSDAKLAKKV